MTILAAMLLGSSQPQTSVITVTLAKVVEGLRPVAMAPAPTGSRFVAAMEDGSVRIIDATTRQTVRELAKHPQPAYAVAWSPDGAFVATGDESARIFVEDTRNGSKVREYRTHTKGIQKLSFNQSRSFLLSTGKDDEIKVYDLTKDAKKEARSILGKGANFYGASFSPKLPMTFATGILGTGGREYNAMSGSVTSFITGHDNQGVYDVAFNPAGTRAVTAGRDGTAIIWDTKGYKKLASLKGHGDWVVYAGFSPNGKLVATGSTDRTVKVWNAQNYTKVADLQAQSGVGSPICFTADGKTLVTVNDAGYLAFNNITPAQAPGATPLAPVKKPAKKKGRG
jgi:WD40 repeat protein